jgi:hypothetical protein
MVSENSFYVHEIEDQEPRCILLVIGTINQDHNVYTNQDKPMSIFFVGSI